MVDGVHFGDHVCVVAMGIDLTGRKHPLSVTDPTSAAQLLDRDPAPL
jgi:hypothetical protein